MTATEPAPRPEDENWHSAGNDRIGFTVQTILSPIISTKHQCLTFLCWWLRSLVCLLAYNMGDWTHWRCLYILFCLSMSVSVRSYVSVCFVCQLICTSGCLYISPSVYVSLRVPVVRVSVFLSACMASCVRLGFSCLIVCMSVSTCSGHCLYVSVRLSSCVYLIRCIWRTFIICRRKAPLAMYHRRSRFAEA